MQKLSKVITGIPLTQTSPAAVEKYLVKKIRDDLGEYADMAIIRPMLRIDKEDGDLSGNLTNGYGMIIVKVIDHSFSVPFIIHQKELLPFDVIRMGDEEVGYDMAKLRKLVVQLDRVQRENTGYEDGGVLGDIVDYKEAPSYNGFLGTIMSVRDNYQPYDMNGAPLYEGDSFGIVDEGRILKFASTDVGEVFEEFHEKLAKVQVFTTEQVKEVAKRVEERFTKEAIENLPKEELMTKEAVEVERSYNALKSEILVDASRAASGNNVKFPVYDGTTLEYRNGRVYKNIAPIAKNPIKTDIKRIVIDASGNYAHLQDRTSFMLSDKPANHFKMYQIKPASMNLKEQYTLEKTVDTLYSPFTVTYKYTTEEENSLLISNAHENEFTEMKTANCKTFRDAFRVEQELGYIGTPHTAYNGQAFIFVLKDSSEPFKEIKFNELMDLITQIEDNTNGVRVAKHIVNSTTHFNPAYSNEKDVAFYVVGENLEIFFPLKTRIKGHFTRPDGLTIEYNMFTKQAAYESVNKGRIIAEPNTRPQTFTLEWTYVEEAGDEGAELQRTQSHSLNNLTPYELKGALNDLGFDERQKATLMQSIKQNGHAIKFDLPSAKLAKNLSPAEKGKEKASEFVKGLANATLHAGNFVPLFRDVATTGISEGISNAIEPLATSEGAVGELLRKAANDSLEVAVELEKVAENLRGSTWFKVAQLVNMKHHLDKLALDIHDGFVKEANEVFGLTSSLKPEISKTSKELIEFNREQLLKVSSNLIPAGLVKEALHQLDGLFGYALVGEKMEKQANFFNFAAKHKEEVSSLDKVIDELRKNQSTQLNHLRESVIRVRAAERQGLHQTNPDAFQHLLEKENENQQKLQATTSELVNVVKKRSDIEGKQEMNNRAIVTSVGVPLSGALGFTAAEINEDN